MFRPTVLILLASTACGAPAPSLPSAPIQVTTTPIRSGETLTLSVEIPKPATELLEVRFYGSSKGAGSKPCVKEVCGGLSEPVEMGTAQFFPKMKTTSVAATGPADAVKGSTYMVQAVISNSSGAVVSEVTSVEITEGPKAAGRAAQGTAARTVHKTADLGSSDCQDERGEAAIAACKAGLTGDVTLCEDIPIHNDRLYCFGLARKSAGACRQVTDKVMRARCLEKVGVVEAKGDAASHDATPNSPAAGASIPDDCAKEENSDWQLVCKARKNRSPDTCAAVQNHDAKLFCYGVMRRSRGSCLQVMNESLEAECLKAIGIR